MKHKLIAFWLDFVNNFLTIEKYAEYHGITKIETEIMLSAGKKLSEA
jgi:hypothetical protein